MKIAQVCYFYRPVIGGVESHVENLSHYLAEEGHTVDVYTSDFSPVDIYTKKERINIQTNSEENIKIKRKKGYILPSLFGLVNLTYINRVVFPGLIFDLFQNGYDIIHVHSFPSNHLDISFITSLLKRKPIVVTGHFDPNDLDNIAKSKARSIYWKTWMKFVLKHISYLIAITDAEKRRYMKYWGVPEERIEVIPNGVNIQELESITDNDRRDFIDKYGLNNKRVILFVGRVCWLKGVDLAIKAFINLLKTNPDLVLLIAGPIQDKDYHRQLLDIIRKNNLEDKVILLGKLSRKELLSAFAISSVQVLPSRGGEAFGIVLIEGMFFKNIVIGSDINGISSVIDDGQTGFLFEKDNSKDLSKKLEYVLNNYDSLEQMRVKAHLKVIEKYDWKKISKQIERIYLNNVK